MATGEGGGIRVGSSSGQQARLTINDSTLDGNEAAFGGGISADQVSVTSSTISNNTATSDGGGIFTGSRGGANIQQSSIFDNTAGRRGGGIRSTGLASINNSTISGNSAASEGGGGIAQQGDYLSIDSSTISGNTSESYGGGVFVDQGGLLITSTTVTQNTTSTIGGGGGVAFINGSQEAGLLSSIVSGNSDPNGHNNLDGSGTYMSSYGFFSGYSSMIGSGDSVYGPDHLFSNAPGLGELSDNGGPTLTHAPLEASPAINAGSCLLYTSDAADE